MPRPNPTHSANELREICRIIQENGIDVPEAAEHLATFRHSHPSTTGHALDCYLIENLRLTRRSISELEKVNREQHKAILELTSEPLHTAIFLRGPATGAEARRAKVLCRNRELVVGVHPDVQLESLVPGDEVLLNRDDAIVALGDTPAQPGGTLAIMQRRLPDGRILVKAREEQIIMQCLEGAAGAKAGDLVRVNLEAHIAFECIEQPRETASLVTDLPVAHRHQLAGQDETYRRLKLALSAALMDRKKAAAYNLQGRNSILVIGPPGTGKTLMVKVAANELSREHGLKCRFAVVKPGSWNSPWFGEAEANVRREFETLNRLADEEGTIVVVYLDELESTARHRGSGIGHAEDKVTAALLAELDGFRERSNVVIVSSTNRKDLIDAALLERLSSTELLVGRPTASAARAIFDVHLPTTVPYSPNGASAPDTRREIIDVAVSRLYAPNGDAKVAQIKFSDGKQRSVTARELVSGRLIAQVCRNACELAFERDVTSGESGVTVRHMETAVEETIERLRTTLTKVNAGNYLPDLPQDTHVVAVDVVRPAAKRTGYYLNETPPTPGS